MRQSQHGTRYSTPAEVREFLNRTGRRVSAPHNGAGKILHWPMCTRCGLMWLKNEATRAELKRPCVTYEDD
jgi:hypothetical protein